MNKIKVWDLPTRICHWLFVLLVIFQYLSAEVLDDSLLENTMQWHFYAGYTLLGLIIFRVIWGFLGTYYARFTQFMVSPQTAFTYLFTQNKENKTTFLGHNPAGAYSIIVLLTLMLTQAGSGLFISDEIFSEGPYYGMLPEFWQDLADYAHHNAYYVLLGFIGLHILAIIYYQFKEKENLSKAMLTGYKTSPEATRHLTNFPWIAFLVSVLATAALMYLVIEVWPTEAISDIYDF